MARHNAARRITGWALPVLAIALSGCANTIERLKEIGGPPALSASGDPTQAPGYRPTSLPMPRPSPQMAGANSLWQAGEHDFFQSQVAARVGDIVTVLVNIADNAEFQNATTTQRAGSEGLGVPNFFGLENTFVPHAFPRSNPASLVSTNSTNVGNGTGAIKRNETVTVRLAGVVTQVLPNGNLVVVARQEVRVNAELRELQISGVVRPQDISSDNTISDDRMAEARIAYGGHGQLTNLQTPRYGQQLLDILLPF